jgi:hypothetical protein
LNILNACSKARTAARVPGAGGFFGGGGDTLTATGSLRREADFLAGAGFRIEPPTDFAAFAFGFPALGCTIFFPWPAIFLVEVFLGEGFLADVVFFLTATAFFDFGAAVMRPGR